MKRHQLHLFIKCQIYEPTFKKANPVEWSQFSPYISFRNVQKMFSTSTTKFTQMLHSRFLFIHSKTDMTRSNIRVKNHLKRHDSNIRRFVQAPKTLDLNKVERGTDKKKTLPHAFQYSSMTSMEYCPTSFFVFMLLSSWRLPSIFPSSENSLTYRTKDRIDRQKVQDVPINFPENK